MKRQTIMRIGAAALALAGLFWCVKAGMIMVTGYQPPLALELGQVFFPLGVMGMYPSIDRPQRLANAGLIAAIIGLVGTSLGLLYPLLPGAQISTGATFVWPYSLFVLIGSVGGFVALLLMGLAIRRSGRQWHRWQPAPVIVALLPLPVSAAGLIHIEIPIFVIGAAWLVLAYGLWRVTNTRALSGEQPSVAA